MDNPVVIRKREVTDAIQAACYLFGKGSATDIQQFLSVVMDEVAIRNAASPDNEQVWLQGTK